MSQEIVDVPVDAIEVSDRLRDIATAEADRIGRSMLEVGQITPIAVSGPVNGRYRLVAGAHRVVGAQMHGIQRLQAVVIEGSADELRLREIDENLYRHELTAYDQAEFIAERREVWERLYGPVKRGGDRRSKVQNDPLVDAMRRGGFIRATAERFSLNQTAVKRALRRKAHIVPELWRHIRGLPAATNAALLDKLAKTTPEDQEAVLRRIGMYGQTVEYAFAEIKRAGRPEDTTPNLTAVKRAWKKADAEERALILDFIDDERVFVERGEIGAAR